MYNISGCPNGHYVVPTELNNTSHDILTDNCDNEWLAPEGAVDEAAEIIINLGCVKSPKGLHLKNIDRAQGGTKGFTIFLSENIDGPWIETYKDEFPEQEVDGCQPVKPFDLR